MNLFLRFPSRIVHPLSHFLIFFLTLMCCVSVAKPKDGVESPYRDPNISYKLYKWGAANSYLAERSSNVYGKSAKQMAKLYNPAQIPIVTEWNSEEELQSLFERVRDFRFTTTRHDPGFLRRISWLYPDDGCYMRAAIANYNLHYYFGVTIPNKVFAFGDLTVKTPNTRTGATSWWYHVAPIVQVKGQFYVLDAAIEPRYPLKLQDWLSRMSGGQPNRLEVAVCGSGTYMPADDCSQISDRIEQRAHGDQPYFFELEWERLEELGRDPRKELGDEPPWLSSCQGAAC